MKVLFQALVLGFLAWYYTMAIHSPLYPIPTHHQFSVFRDDNGIPHIVAEDKLSAFFGMGYAYAQDRLWTLNVRKLVLQGRLAEVFGAEALQMDLEMRNYDFRNVGVMNAKLLDEETRSFVQAYCDGVNTYARQSRILPFEFYLSWSGWEDWTPADTLSNVAFFSFVLEFDWMYEIARQRLAETVGFSLAWKMMPFGENNLFREVTIVNNQELKEQGKYKFYNSSKIEQILKQHWIEKTLNTGSIHIPETQYEGMGSNAWVIGGNHTDNGKPLLANDPHLGLLLPSLFYMYEVSLLKKGTKDIQSQAFGVMMDGLPAMSIGINDNFAWGSTASYVDNKDVFHETVRDNNGSLEYFFKGEWKPFTLRQEVFKVRGQADYVKNFYHSHRGPVIEHVFLDIHFKYGYPIPNHYRINHTLTISSAIYFPDATSLKGLTNLAFSNTTEEMEERSSEIHSPNIDSVWIDSEGNYGYRSVGRTARRNIPEMGSFIKDGTTDLYDMVEFLDYKDFPVLLNPKKGYISMANNKFAEDSFVDRCSIHEISTGRSYRLDKFISEKIKRGEKFNHETMKKLQLDHRDEFLSEAFPFVLDALRKVPELWSNPTTDQYFELLSKWDYYMPKQSIEASIYHVFEHVFQESLLHGTTLSEHERKSILNHAFFEVYQFILFTKTGEGNLTEEEATLCRNELNQNYTNLHPCIVNIGLSFAQLPALLERLFKSKDIKEYQWGKIHQHVFKAIPWSDVPLLGNIWTRYAPAGGNSRTVNVAILTHQTNSYNSIAGPVFRFITDLNRTEFSLDAGESDRVYSTFYDNFLGKDRYVEYKKENPLKKRVPGWHISANTLRPTQ